MNPTLAHQYFCVDLKNWFDGICNPGYSNNLLDGAGNQGTWNQDYVDLLNTTGSNIVFHQGHGEIDSWCLGDNCYQTGALTTGFKMTNLANSGKYPFVISQACNTGAFTSPTNECMAEKLTKYSPSAGYVGYIGAWTAASMVFTQPNEFPFTFEEHILNAIYKDLSTIVGEAVLEARIAVFNPSNSPEYFPLDFQYNLLADPAYNLMAPGYEITQNTTLPAQTMISTKVTVVSGVTLSIPNYSVLEFSENGQLIIKQGATLEIGNNVSIKGQDTINKIIIEGTLCGTGGSINNPVPLSLVGLSALTGHTWKGIQFNNPDLTVILNNCILSNCYISGDLSSFNATTSTHFTNSGINLNQSGLLVDGCIFTNSNILLTNDNESGVSAQILNSSFLNSPEYAIIRIEHYPEYLIKNSTINYDHGTGIDLYYCGNGNNQYSIKNNTVQKSGSSQDMSWGIRVYRTFADIENNLVTNNRYGITTLNQSQVRLIGNANATSNSETQQIIDNYQNQVRASDNSFPFYFHHNILQNTPSGNTYLVYYNPSKPSPDNPAYLFNVKCNCFDNTNPPPQLYPIGGYQWSIWCPPNSNCQITDQGAEQLGIAMASMDSADYATAEVQLKAIISTYPGTIYAIESAKKLIPLKKLSDQDFPGLEIYYDTTTALHADTLSDHLVYRLKNICRIEEQAYPASIAWFENDIMNPASLNDSVYSLIDLGDTYLLMQHDSTLKSSFANYTGTLSQYKPKNLQEHISTSNEWLKLLFKDDPFKENGKGTDPSGNQFMLNPNIPNPFSGTTELSYNLPEPAKISIKVTNMLGQEVLEIVRNYQNAGLYTIKINLNEQPDGIYLIALIVDNKQISKIKAIKTH